MTSTHAHLRDYGGRMLTIDGRPTVQLVDPNDNARRRFQYRRDTYGGLEKRILAHDGQPFRDTGSLWAPVSPTDLAAMWQARGRYHPILDPLGVL